MEIVGNSITKKEKEIFQRVLNTQDLMDVSQTVNVSLSTVKNVYYRTVTITEENKHAYFAIRSKAFEKIEHSLSYFRKAKSDLLETVPVLNQN